ncbi:unnamed protein product [Linum trigynum]|uniref:Uncharacterized protein n=1 Tax=Linum trigynum TaxID=586398 RepID=A0AAV2G8J7_9ROSI
MDDGKGDWSDEGRGNSVCSVVRPSMGLLIGCLLYGVDPENSTCHVDSVRLVSCVTDATGAQTNGFGWNDRATTMGSIGSDVEVVTREKWKWSRNPAELMACHVIEEALCEVARTKPIAFESYSVAVQRLLD